MEEQSLWTDKRLVGRLGTRRTSSRYKYLESSTRPCPRAGNVRPSAKMICQGWENTWNLENKCGLSISHEWLDADLKVLKLAWAKAAVEGSETPWSIFNKCLKSSWGPVFPEEEEALGRKWGHWVKQDQEENQKMKAVFPILDAHVSSSICLRHG